MTTSYLLSRRDLDFLLHDWLDVRSMLARERYRELSPDMIDAIMDLSEDIAGRYFATHNKRNDREEPWLDDGRVCLHSEVRPALDAFAEAAMFGATLDECDGGTQFPQTVAVASFAWFQAANIATASYPFLTLAAARLLCEYGDPGLRSRYVPGMAGGRFFGTMCLSEPQAGSQLSEITTRALPQPDGQYRVFGAKMWISGGDHELSENIIHLVLAKISGGPAGVKGISLFVVPKFLEDEQGAPIRNDVAVTGLNHKMGYRGTVNAALSFGDGTFAPYGEAGAVGHLVGEPHRGLEYMFQMMNEARVGVGAGAAALGYTAYLKSLDYARTREQGRPRNESSVGTAQVPILEHADVRRMLVAQKSYVEGALALVLFCARLVDDAQTAENSVDRDRARLLLDVLTPLAKSWPSQWCLAANDLAIQVLGGYGYTRDYDVEQHYRDNRLNPIHEGTHGMQALDLLGRKMSMRDGAGLALLRDTMLASVAQADGLGGEAAEWARALRDRIERWVRVTHTVHDPDTGLSRAHRLANASVYLEAVGHVVIAWIWLEQLMAATRTRSQLLPGKTLAARYFFQYELPKVDPQFELVESMDSALLGLDPTWL